MTKVTVHTADQAPLVETPSQTVVRAANEVFPVTDSLGRVIGIKRLGPVQRLHMLKLIGGQNEHYMGMASLAFLVESIDGTPVSKPVNELQLDGLIGRLGDEGIEAVANGVVEHFGTEEAKTRDEIKNG
jgi:hypothetical protein